MNILVNGICGKMGKAVVEVAQKFDDLCICEGVDCAVEIQKNLQNFSNLTQSKTNLLTSIFCSKNCDVVIDFSSADSVETLLKFCVSRKKPLVIATTGHNEFQQNLIQNASKHIPIFKCANMSLGANALIKAVKSVLPILHNFDIQIVECHHSQKKDAPSGTAKNIFDEICNASKEQKKFAKQNVQIHSLRGGGVMGNHEVLFLGETEILQITHTALSRSCFAEGALKAAKFVLKKQNGLYSMTDLIENDL